MPDIDPLDGALRRLEEHARAAATLPASAQIRARATRRRQRRHAAVAGLGAFALLAGVSVTYALQPRSDRDDSLVTATNRLPHASTPAAVPSTTAGPESTPNPTGTPTDAPSHGSSGRGPSAGASALTAIPTTTAPGTLPTDRFGDPADSRAREVTRVNLVGWSSRGADETYLWALVSDACGALATLADQAQPAGGAGNVVIRDGCLHLGEHPVYLRLKLSPRGLLVVTATEHSLLSPDNPQTLPLTGFLAALNSMKLLDLTQTQPKSGAPSIPADITTDAQNVIVAINELPSSAAGSNPSSSPTSTTP